MTSISPELTIVTVNYNSSDFVATMIRAIVRFTVRPWCMIICDNGSKLSDLASLRRTVSFNDNIRLIERRQTQSGSMGHGEALNILVKNISTRYGVILDADCVPLMSGWDQFLLSKINGQTIIAGAPVAKNSPGSSPRSRSFPLIFLCLFDASVIENLSIDFRPKNIEAGEDTGWELESKCTSAGYLGFGLYGQNTRTYNAGLFSGNICDEYYCDESCARLICSHFGRGSDPWAGKYRFLIGGRWLRYKYDKCKWLFRVNDLISRTDIR